MRKLKDAIVNPSGFDSLANYVGEIPDAKWLVVLTRSRDSDVLSESNWESALQELGGESETVEIFRFGHWACGWWEALCVAKGSKSEELGRDIEEKLEGYPVLDESDFSEREQEEANRVWANFYTVRQRIEYIRKNRNQFEFRSFADLKAQVKGEYFGGYSSDLIN